MYQAAVAAAAAAAVALIQRAIIDDEQKATGVCKRASISGAYHLLPLIDCARPRPPHTVAEVDAEL